MTERKITADEARTMREAMFADPTARAELRNANHPGHSLRMRELDALNHIEFGHLLEDPVAAAASLPKAAEGEPQPAAALLNEIVATDTGAA